MLGLKKPSSELLRHYDRTRELFCRIAKERGGRYAGCHGAQLSRAQRKIRVLTEGALDELLVLNIDATRLVDVGCGRGDFTQIMATRYPQLTTLCGCDFCPEVLAIAEGDNPEPHRIAFKAGAMPQLPFEQQAFDLTLCINTLHHVAQDDIASALGDLARITKHHLVIEIKNDRSPYFSWIHSGQVERVPIYPTNRKRVSDVLCRHGFFLRSSKSLWGIEWLSPLLLLVFCRSER